MMNILMIRFLMMSRSKTRLGTAEAPALVDASASTVPPIHRVPSYLVRRLHQICVALNHEATAGFGFTGHVGALMEIRHSPGIDQKRLAAMLGADERSTGQFVDVLEAQGIVERRIAQG